MEDELKTKIATIKNWLGSGSINIFGQPFSGKDTHGKELASFLEGPLIGGGDILRGGPTTPKHVLEEINKGNLAPTEEYKQIVLPYLQQSAYDNLPLILSSVGRWLGEEVSVLEACEQSGHPVKAVVYLKIPKQEVKNRWKSNQRERHDDASEHILEKRLSEFHDKTLPVIKTYKDKDLLLEIDATPSIPLVTNKIIEELYLKATA